MNKKEGPKNQNLSLESLEKIKKNNINILKNLYSEYNKIFKTNEKIRDLEEIELEIQTTTAQIKEVSQQIHQQNLIKNTYSKDLATIETLGFPLKKREHQRAERECQQLELHNKTLKEKNKKIEEKIDLILGKYDKIKEKQNKHLIVAQKMHINLNPVLVEQYKEVQKRIKTDSSNFLICNRRDENNYKNSEKRKVELMAERNGIEEKIQEFDKKIKYQRDFLQKSLENPLIKEILDKDVHPTRLFLENPFRLREKKDMKRKPISLVNLQRAKKIDKKENFQTNQSLSVGKTKNRKINVNKDANPIFSVPFSIKKQKGKFETQKGKNSSVEVEKNYKSIEYSFENNEFIEKNHEDFDNPIANQENLSFKKNLLEGTNSNSLRTNETKIEENQNNHKNTFNFHKKLATNTVSNEKENGVFITNIEKNPTNLPSNKNEPFEFNEKDGKNFNFHQKNVIKNPENNVTNPKLNSEKQEKKLSFQIITPLYKMNKDYGLKKKKIILKKTKTNWSTSQKKSQNK